VWNEDRHRRDAGEDVATDLMGYIVLLKIAEHIEDEKGG
jgi:hypothetical protein